MASFAFISHVSYTISFYMHNRLKVLSMDRIFANSSTLGSHVNAE